MSRITLALAFVAGVAATLFAGAANPANAQRGDWQSLAKKKVNMLADRDVIDLGRSNGRFNALRFNARRGNINMYRIRVTFGNGETQDLEINRKLREGDDSGAIDLKGRARVIDRIEMLYASSNLLSRAELEVFGRLRPGTARVEPDEDRDERRDDQANANLQDWKKLGQRYVDLDFDRDRIWVGKDEGLFDQIVFRAKGGKIRLFNVKVIYGNGLQDDLRVTSVLRAGEQTRPLDLRGRNRGIRRIELQYERGGRGQSAVLLEAYGRPAGAKTAQSDDDEVDNEDDQRRDRWSILGSREVDLSTDRDAITVERGDGPFDAIALRARRTAVMVYDIRVTYGNGKRQTFRLDKRLRPGKRSEPIDLKGQKRRITKVELLYEKANDRGRRARVQVLGRNAERRSDAGNADNAGQPDAAPIPSGWARVGQVTLTRDSRDGKLNVTGNRERFREIALRTTGAPVEINRIMIRFRNGRTMRLRVNGTMRPGDRTNPIDLKGNRRRIEAIELDFEPVRGRREATVEVIGKR